MNFQDFLINAIDTCKSKYIAIPEQEKERYGKHFEALCSKIFGILRSENPHLDSLIAEYSLEGSTGDMLKVAKPNEFDLVFKLQIPYYESIIVSRDSNIPGNVFLDMTRVLKLLEENPREDYQRFRKLLQVQLVNAQNFLDVDKLCSWLQSLFSRSLNRIANCLEVDGILSQLKYRICGPAHTIFVNGDLEYSVDFVPAIRLGATQNVLLPGPLRYFNRANLTYWEAIPKPLKIQTQTSSISFRSSFYAAEREMLRDKPESCRDAIKLMKNFRDVRTNLGHLKSYYIKTLFLWKIRNEPEAYWHMPVTVILPDMFDELAHCLRHGVLPFYWDPELNMLEVLTTDQVLEMYLCVEKIPTALRGGRYGDRQKCYSRIDILRVFSHKNRKKSRVNKPKWNGIERMKSIPNVCT